MPDHDLRLSFRLRVICAMRARCSTPIALTNRKHALGIRGRSDSIEGLNRNQISPSRVPVFFGAELRAERLFLSTFENRIRMSACQDANGQTQVPERRLQVGAALKSRSHTVEVGMKRGLRGVP